MFNRKGTFSPFGCLVLNSPMKLREGLFGKGHKIDIPFVSISLTILSGLELRELKNKSSLLISRSTDLKFSPSEQFK